MVRVVSQLQVKRRTAKAHRPKTNALPLDHATNLRGGDRVGCQCDCYSGAVIASPLQRCPRSLSLSWLEFSD